jgi:hypothetical protein
MATWDDKVPVENPFVAFATSADPNTMYYHKVMAQPDQKQFVEAMQQEVCMQTDNGNWSVVKWSDVQKTDSVLPAVLAMTRKRRTATR